MKSNKCGRWVRKRKQRFWRLRLNLYQEKTMTQNWQEREKIPNNVGSNIGFLLTLSHRFSKNSRKRVVDKIVRKISKQHQDKTSGFAARIGNKLQVMLILL